MSGRHRSTIVVALAALAAAALSGRAEEQPPAPGRAPAPAGTTELGGAERRLMHLAVDKPYHRPGETIYVRGFILDAFTQAPVAAPGGSAQVEIRSPKGDIVFQTWLGLDGALLHFAWPVPPEQPGGEYRVVVKPGWNGGGYPEAETTFTVRDYRAPRLRTELELLRKAYGPGDEVVATLVASRAEGGIPAGARVTAIARVDGAEVHRASFPLDALGGCIVKFTLPKEIAEGEGSLACTIEDGGVVETAAKTLPIVLAKVKLDLFPEGGDLVLGAPSRLYVEAHTPRGEPADVAGRVIAVPAGAEAAGGLEMPVARFRTSHEGRGKVAFTPMPGWVYRVAIDEPAGIRERFAVPTPTADGLALEALDESVAPDAPVRVRLSAGVSWGTPRIGAERGEASDGRFVGKGAAAGRAGVVVARHERDLMRVDVDLAPGESKEVALPLKGDFACGVLRVTAFDAAGRPRAERLVFRRPSRQLRIAVAPFADRTTIRGPIAVQVKVFDAATGAPVPGALLGLSAVDDAVLASVEKRDRAPRIPEQALLSSEVRELKDPQAYLADGPEAARALDLLLGTQGWRRFALVEWKSFLEKHGAAAARALALRVDPVVIFERLRALKLDDAELRKAGVVLLFKEEEALAAAAKAKADRAAAAEAGGWPEDAAGGRGGVLLGAPLALPKPVPMAAPAGRPEAPQAGAPQNAKDPAAEAPPAVVGKVIVRVGKNEEDKRKARDRRFGGERAFEEVGWVGGGLLYVREYAHRAQPTTPGAPRTDFAETLYWSAGTFTGADGSATVQFDAADSVTSYRIRADGVSAQGALGAGDALVEVRKPFYLEPKLPLEVTAGDWIDAPVAIVNGTAGRLDVKVHGEAGKGLLVAPKSDGMPRQIGLAADGRGRVYLPIEVDRWNGAVAVRVAGEAGESRDEVVRNIPVVPFGFPMELAAGGRLAPGASVKVPLRIPESVEPTSIRAEAAVYPTPLASLQEAVSALLREPGGCFEQTSATSYPNVMVMRYLASHPGVDASIVAKATGLLDRGYKRLVGFECKQKGFEWFGGDPGHEALTAYGLLQFTDMAAVYPVDRGMLERTRQWLLGRRNGKGGYERNSRALDTFGAAPEDVTDLYITWSLCEAGEPLDGLAKEIERARERGQGSNDSYVQALAANILLAAKDGAAGVVLDRIVKHQAEDGHVGGAATSITRSGGNALEIETTSLAALAWLRSPAHTAQVERAMTWLLSRCKGGAFGSTQSTILALRAVLAYDAAHATPKAPGTLLLTVDGKVVDEVPFTTDRQGAISFPAFAEALKPGAHEVELKMVGGSDMPYSMVVRYTAATPASSERCKVRLSAALSKAEVREGETVDLAVELANATDEGLPMAVAVVGLPAGLEPRPERLRELVKAGEIDAFETRGRELVFYRRCMAPKETRKLTLDLVAAIPGRYSGAASRAYLYYTDEDVCWIPGLAVKVARAQ